MFVGAHTSIGRTVNELHVISPRVALERFHLPIKHQPTQLSNLKFRVVDRGLGASIGSLHFDSSAEHSLQFLDVANDADHTAAVLERFEDYEYLF
jgi:hypothetical protein